MLKVIHYVSVMNRAGQETFIMNLFRKIDRSEIQFDFLCSENRPGDYDKEIHALGGHIFYLPPVTTGGARKQLDSIRAVRQVLKTHPCDVLHIHTSHAFDAAKSALAARMAGVEMIVVHSHSTSNLCHRTVHKLCRPLLSLLPNRRFACSRAAGHWMFCGDRFQVIHNGLDLDVCHYDAAMRETVRREMGWDGKHIIGHVGRFDTGKNHRFLIEVFEKVHENDLSAQLVLVGQGELEAEIRALVEQKRLTDAVSFLGVRDDVIRLYQGMDLLLFPSLFEGLGIVLIEAQACDLPCLVSDAIPKEAYVSDNIMQLSLEENVGVWATKAMEMLSVQKTRRDNRAQIRAAGYDIGQLAAQLKDIYLA